MQVHETGKSYPNLQQGFPVLALSPGVSKLDPVNLTIGVEPGHPTEPVYRGSFDDLQKFSVSSKLCCAN
jgi:hypothetical protein